MHTHKLILFLTTAMLLAACDEGTLYEDVVISSADGRTVKASGSVSGIGSWAGGHQLVIAGFADSEYAEITKEISGDVTVLSGIPDNVISVEICAINRLRKRVATFTKLDIDDASDTIRWDIGNVTGSMFDAIQTRVFDTTCANCHGASNKAAAGLYLTAGRSYDAIVGKPSTVSEDDVIVVPGRPDNSLIYKMLTSDLTSSWIYDHSVEVVDQSVIDLISAWIENNAQR